MKNLIIKSAFIAAILLTVSYLDAAATHKPGHQSTPSHNHPPAGVPIDGGASALLAAGAVYGLKKLRDFRKKNN